MSEENKTIEQTRVSRLTVGRVHNLGNYENIRYEVVVDVKPGDDPAKIIGTVERILDDLQFKSGVSEWDLRRAVAALSKGQSELDEYEQKQMERYSEIVRNHEEAMARREKARQALPSLSYSEEFKDAKRDWDDCDDRNGTEF